MAALCLVSSNNCLSSVMTNFTKTLELSFTTLEFYESIVISTVKEDVVFDENHVKEVYNICSKHFGTQDFVYIANRKYNYNVNPIIYFRLFELPTLKGIAIISDQIQKLQTANFEKQFSPVPFELFQKKEEAFVWSKRIVQQ